MDTGDTAWMLASTALVMLMVPGLAFFYGGMVRAKSVLNIMMMVMYALAIMPVVWFLWGYTGAFGDDIGGGLLGGGESLGLKNITLETLSGTHPTYVFVVFQMLFCVITIGLVAGAIADRAKFVGLDGVRPALGDLRLRPDRALGLRLRRRHHRRAGGSRTSSARSTSPAAPPSR